jgi:hypothetical protein
VGSYTVYVYAEDPASGLVASASITGLTIISPALLSATDVTMTADTPSPQLASANPSIGLTASVVAGTGLNVTYQIQAYNTFTKVWTHVSPTAYMPATGINGTKPTFSATWTPTAGTYDLFVYAIDPLSGLKASYEMPLYTVYSPNLISAKGLTLTASLPTPQVAGTPLTLTANVPTTTGTATNLQYRFTVYDNTTSAYTVNQTTYGAAGANTLSWTPTVAGSYYIVVYAQDPITDIADAAALTYVIK